MPRQRKSTKKIDQDHKNYRADVDQFEVEFVPDEGVTAQGARKRVYSVSGLEATLVKLQRLKAKDVARWDAKIAEAEEILAELNGL
jgi:hypothetical protein